MLNNELHIDSKLKEIIQTNNGILSSVNAWISQMKKYLSKESSQNPKVIFPLQRVFESITSAIYENDKLLSDKVEPVILVDRIANIIYTINEIIGYNIDYEHGALKSNYKVNKIGCDVIYEVIKNAVKHNCDITITAKESDLNTVTIMIVATGDFDSVSELERLKLRDIGGTIEIIKKDKGNSFEITLPILQSKDVQALQTTGGGSAVDINGGVSDSVVVSGDGNIINIIKK